MREGLRTFGRQVAVGTGGRRAPDIATLLTVLCIVGGSWLFLHLADEVNEGATQAFDEWGLRLLRDPTDLGQPRGPSWLRGVARDLTALGSPVNLLLLGAAVLGFFALRRRFALCLFVLAALGGSIVLDVALKMGFARERPAVVPHLTEVFSASFPSGHALMSAAVFLSLGALVARADPRRRVKLYVLGLALALTGIVGLTRLYLGVHYPTDVLAGWMLGIAWAWLCGVVVQWFQRRGTVE